VLCDRAQECAVAFVLGDLDGSERAALIDHLSECQPCQAEVASLTSVVDGLARVVPPIPLSAEFVRRVVDSLPDQASDAAPAGSRPLVHHRALRIPRRHLFVATLAILAVAALLAVVIGVRTSGPGPGKAAVGVPLAATGLRTANGAQVGQAVLFVRPRPSVDVSVELPSSVYSAVRGPYWVVVVGRDGRSLAQGRIGLLDGRGALDEELGTVTDVALVRVTSPNGLALCSGPFGPPGAAGTTGPFQGPPPGAAPPRRAEGHPPLP